MTTAKQKSAVLEALKDLYAEHGELTPELVVQAAKDEASPLHDQFEWDDAVAAHLHRCETARGLIVSYSVTETVESRAAPYFVRDPNAAPNEQGYRPLLEIRDNRQDALALLNEELRRIESLLVRLETIADTLGLHDRVAPVISDIRRLKSTLTIEV